MPLPSLRLVAALAAAALASAPLSPARAQDAPISPEDDEAAAAGAPAPAPVAPVDDAAEAEAYERAFELMVAGRYEEAVKLFDEIAARTANVERAAAAREMARLGRRLTGQGGPRVAGTIRDDGRIDFIVTTTMASFYTGFALDDLFDVTDFRAQTLVVAGTTFAGFGAAVYGTRGRRITGGMAQAYGTGLMLGLGNGLLLASPLGIEPEGGDGDAGVNELFLGFGLVTMAAGGTAGMLLGDRFGVTRAQPQLTGLLAINGLATVGLGLVIFQPDDPSTDGLLLSLAAGLDVGAGMGIYLSPKIDWRASRVSYVTLAEFLGVVGGFTAGVLVVGTDPDAGGEKTMAALVLGGMWGGFALGTYLTRDMPPDPNFRRGKGAPQPASAQQGVTWQLAPVFARGGAPGLGVVGMF